MAERLVRGILLSVLGGALSTCGPSPATPTPVPTQSLSPPVFTPAPPSTRPASVLADATLSGSVYAFTDSTGSYVFPPGVWTEGRPDFPVRLWISKKATKTPRACPALRPVIHLARVGVRSVINGNTRFDAELVRE